MPPLLWGNCGLRPLHIILGFTTVVGYVAAAAVALQLLL